MLYARTTRYFILTQLQIGSEQAASCGWFTSHHVLLSLPLTMQIFKMSRSLDHDLWLVVWPVFLKDLEATNSLALIDPDNWLNGRELHKSTTILFLQCNDLLQRSCSM